MEDSKIQAVPGVEDFVAVSPLAAAEEEEEEEEEEPDINENADQPTPPSAAAAATGGDDDFAELDALRAYLTDTAKGGYSEGAIAGTATDDEPEIQFDDLDEDAKAEIRFDVDAAAATKEHEQRCDDCPCPELEAPEAERPIATTLSLRAGLGMWFDEDGQVLKINPGERPSPPRCACPCF
jgi:hypothetical protein